jgi:hypothetical protein
MSVSLWAAGATWRKKLVRCCEPLAVVCLKPNSSAASMILMNNDFASIPVAIEMGRLVFDNLKKVILYLMPVSFTSPSS